MNLPKPYFRRQQEQRTEILDTFSYVLSQRVKQQILMILESSKMTSCLSKICDKLRFELGTLKLCNYQALYFSEYKSDKIHECAAFFMETDNNEYACTILEYIGCLIVQKYEGLEIIKAINRRLRHERIGYRLEEQSYTCRLVKIEDELFFEQCSSRTLGLLSNKKFKSSLRYYDSSYEKLSKNNFEDALVDIAKAIESLIKTRLTESGITFEKKDSLARLLDICQKNIVNTNHNFQYFKELIKDVGRVRNNYGAHAPGEGEKLPLDEIYVRFVINQAAANLLFLAEVQIEKTS